MQGGTFSLPGHLQETSPSRGDAYARDCPARQLLDRIGDKWSSLTLLLLGEEEMRFNVLKRRIDGISQKMLSQTLRLLERDGLVTRTVEATVPVTVTYRITPLGSELLSAMQLMIDWAETRMSDVQLARSRFDTRMTASAITSSAIDS